MFSGAALFETASALATYSNTRQSAIAQNIANADTPGYKARDLLAFSDVYEGEDQRLALKITNPKHFSENVSGFSPSMFEVERPGNGSPNGNTVSLETEMISAAETKHSYDLALTVYRSGMSLLRTALGRGA